MSLHLKKHILSTSKQVRSKQPGKNKTFLHFESLNARDGEADRQDHDHHICVSLALYSILAQPRATFDAIYSVARQHKKPRSHTATHTPATHNKTTLLESLERGTPQDVFLNKFRPHFLRYVLRQSHPGGNTFILSCQPQPACRARSHALFLLILYLDIA